MLSPHLLDELRAHYRRLRPQTSCLAVSRRRWHNADYPISDKVVWHACREAAQRAGIKRRFIRTLFATASPLTCWRTAPTCGRFRLLLGHRDLKRPRSTSIFRQRHLSATASPLDALPTFAPALDPRGQVDATATAGGGRH